MRPCKSNSGLTVFLSVAHTLMNTHEVHAHTVLTQWQTDQTKVYTNIPLAVLGKKRDRKLII